jgi:hypothetical protein
LGHWKLSLIKRCPYLGGSTIGGSTVIITYTHIVYVLGCLFHSWNIWFIVKQYFNAVCLCLNWNLFTIISPFIKEIIAGDISEIMSNCNLCIILIVISMVSHVCHTFEYNSHMILMHPISLATITLLVFGFESDVLYIMIYIGLVVEVCQYCWC